MNNKIELPQFCLNSDTRFVLGELYRCRSWEKAAEYLDSLENPFLYCLVISESDPKKLCHLSSSEVCDYEDRKRQAADNRLRYLRKTCQHIYNFNSWETVSDFLESLPFFFRDQVILSCDTQAMPYLTGKELQIFWGKKRAIYLKNAPEFQTPERIYYDRNYLYSLCSSSEEANEFLKTLLPSEAKKVLLSCDIDYMRYLTDETRQEFWKQKREIYSASLKERLNVETGLTYLYDHCFSLEEAQAFLEPLGTNFCHDIFLAYDQERNSGIYEGLRNFRTALEKEATLNTSFIRQDINHPHDFLYYICSTAREAFDFLAILDKDTHNQIILDCDTNKMPYLTGQFLRSFWNKKAGIYINQRQSERALSIEDAHTYLRKYCTSEEEAEHFLDFLPSRDLRRKVILSCDGKQLSYLNGILVPFYRKTPLTPFKFSDQPYKDLRLDYSSINTYCKLYEMIESANKAAKAAKKPLHIILADCHIDRMSLFTSSLVMHICKDLRIKMQFGAELFPEESVTTKSGIKVFGFDKVKQLAEEANKKNIWLKETDEHSTMPENLRKNVQFLMQLALRLGMETFLTDSKGALDYTADEKEGEDYPGMPDFYREREADMVDILDEKAAQGISVISQFGYAHIEELHKLIDKKENPEAHTLFIDPVSIGFLTNDRVHTTLANAKNLKFDQQNNSPIVHIDLPNCPHFAEYVMGKAEHLATERNLFIRLKKERGDPSPYDTTPETRWHTNASGSANNGNWRKRIEIKPQLVKSYQRF